MSSTVAGAGATAIAVLGLTLAGCSTAAETPGSETSTTGAAAPPTAEIQPTIAGYIQRNGIAETPVRRGDSGAPTVTLPIPADWRPAGEETPDWAYDAIVYAGPDAPGYPPSVIALMSRLTGDVDPATLLDLAPGELRNMPGYQPIDHGGIGTLGGYPAYHLSGTWVQDAQTKFIAQQTVVIPGSNGSYVLQLNGDGLQEQAGIVGAVMDQVVQQTTVTP